MNEQLQRELLMSEIEGYTRVEFRFNAKVWGKCYYVDHRCQLIIPVSVTKSVENFTSGDVRCVMWVKDWFYEKKKFQITLKGER